jgi:hypothetical protein
MKKSFLSLFRQMPVLLLGLGLASANVAHAGSFAATTVSPASQAVEVGDSFSVNLVFTPGTSPTNGISTPLTFNSSVLQFTSASSTYGSALFNTTNAAAGSVGFSLNYSSLPSTTVATFNFLAIAAGSSVLDINPQQYLIGYGWYGINGLAVDGSVTVAPSSAPVPDAASTVALLGVALLGFAVLRRRVQA